MARNRSSRRRASGPPAVKIQRGTNVHFENDPEAQDQSDTNTNGENTVGDNPTTDQPGPDETASDKDTTPAPAETLAPDSAGVTPATEVPEDAKLVTTPKDERTQDLGVQTGGLSYYENEDGTRAYPEQDKDVDVTVDEDAKPEETS